MGMVWHETILVSLPNLRVARASNNVVVYIIFIFNVSENLKSKGTDERRKLFRVFHMYNALLMHNYALIKACSQMVVLWQPDLWIVNSNPVSNRLYASFLLLFCFALWNPKTIQWIGFDCLWTCIKLHHRTSRSSFCLLHTSLGHIFA